MAGREFDPAVARDAVPEPWHRVERGARLGGTALFVVALLTGAAGVLWLVVRHGPEAGLARAIVAAGASPATLAGAGVLVHGATVAALAGAWCWGLALLLSGLFDR